MPDGLPSPRYRIVERGGRLEVIDSETGGRPATAAERMAAHDAAHGHAALRFDRLADMDEPAAAPPEPSLPPEPAARPVPTDAIRAAIAQRVNPWGGRAQLGAQSQSEERARPSPGVDQGSARPGPHARARRDKGRQPVNTSKWWDSKGPRTLDLGQAGRARLSSSLMTAFVISIFVMVAVFVIQPVLLLVAGFALFRFGGTIIGPIGARLIDEAIKADATGR